MRDSALGASCVGAGPGFSSGLGSCWGTCFGNSADGCKGIAPPAGRVSGLAFLIKDLLCLIDKTAKLRQVTKNKTDKTVVVRVRNAFVFVPNIDSTSEKLSTKPPPLPLWINIRITNKEQTITCMVIIKPIIFNEQTTYGA